MDRKRVENLLTIAKCGDPYMPGSVELGELCKAWLALDAAPVGRVTVYRPGSNVGAVEVWFDEGVPADPISGQQVRLVATSVGE